MTKQQQIKELRNMVGRTISGFKGKDEVTKKVNKYLARAYHDLWIAYDTSDGWISKSKKKAMID